MDVLRHQFTPQIVCMVAVAVVSMDPQVAQAEMHLQLLAPVAEQGLKHHKVALEAMVVMEKLLFIPGVKIKWNLRNT
jgi:hypothetical protein